MVNGIRLREPANFSPLHSYPVARVFGYIIAVVSFQQHDEWSAWEGQRFILRSVKESLRYASVISSALFTGNVRIYDDRKANNRVISAEYQ